MPDAASLTDAPTHAPTDAPTDAFAAPPAAWLLPSWSKPDQRIGSVMTTRGLPGPDAMAAMGARPASTPASSIWQPGDPPYDDINLGDHVGDAPATVARHRAALVDTLGAAPAWLKQVHGNHVPEVNRASAEGSLAVPIEADGSWTREPGVACTVMVADCLPVLLAAPEGRGVAALHAGWRGLAGAGAMAGRGVIEVGVAQLCEGAGCEPSALQAWLGPCIGPQAFEVGEEVLRGFGVNPAQAHPRFQPHPSPGKWLGDLAGLAADRLRTLGVRHISGGAWCTVADRSHFFSFRRDGVTGRQAACIWIKP